VGVPSQGFLVDVPSRGFLVGVQGTALDMMEDVNTGIGWVLSRIRHYGGDPRRVYLVGQSCGAQLSMMCLVTQVLASQHTANCL